MTEQHHPVVADEVVKVDWAVGGFGVEVRCRVAKTQWSFAFSCHCASVAETVVKGDSCGRSSKSLKVTFIFVKVIYKTFVENQQNNRISGHVVEEVAHRGFFSFTTLL